MGALNTAPAFVVFVMKLQKEWGGIKGYRYENFGIKDIDYEIFLHGHTA